MVSCIFLPNGYLLPPQVSLSMVLIHEQPFAGVRCMLVLVLVLVLVPVRWKWARSTRATYIVGSSKASLHEHLHEP